MTTQHCVNETVWATHLFDLIAQAPTRYRVFALYTVTETHLLSPPPDFFDSPISMLFDGSRFQHFYVDRQTMFPMMGVWADIAATSLDLPSGITDWHAQWTLLRFPSDRIVVMVALNFLLDVSGSFRGPVLVQLRERLDGGRATLPLDGWQHDLGPDFHQVMMIPGEHAQEFGLDPLAEDVQRLIATKTEDVRPAFQSARMPRDANRYLGTVAAVTPGASVVGGQDEHVQRACLVAAMQIMGSMASLRAVFDRAYAEIGKHRRTLFAAGDRLDRADVTRLAYDVRSLQLDLSFEVEAHQQVRLAVPLLPVEDFHHELTGCLGMTGASATTSRMIERLTAALDAELGRLSLEEAEVGAKRSRRAEAWVFGLTALASVSVPITLILALLGANVSEVANVDGRPPSIWEARFLPYYVVLLLIPTAFGSIAWFIWNRNARRISRQSIP